MSYYDMLNGWIYCTVILLFPGVSKHSSPTGYYRILIFLFGILDTGMWPQTISHNHRLWFLMPTRGPVMFGPYFSTTQGYGVWPFQSHLLFRCPWHWGCSSPDLIRSAVQSWAVYAICIIAWKQITFTGYRDILLHLHIDTYCTRKHLLLRI